MNFYKRSITSILRRPAKMILLLLLVFILGTAATGAIVVRNAFENTSVNLRVKMPAIVTTYFDFNSFNNTVDDRYSTHELPASFFRERVDVEHVHLLNALHYVENFNYVIKDFYHIFDLQGYIPNFSEYEWDPFFDVFLFFGSSSAELVHIQNEMVTLTSGRQFEEADLFINDHYLPVAIISEALANKNNLTIGSTFIIPKIVNYLIEDPRFGDHFREENIYEIIESEFEIIGLFTLPDLIVIPENEEQEMKIWDQMSRLNTIYVPNWSLEEIMKKARDANKSMISSIGAEMDPDIARIMQQRDSEVQPIFILTDPMLFDDFKQAAEEILPEFYSVVDMSGSFRNIEVAMENLQEIANFVMYFSIMAITLILSLLITLFLHDRRHEMGIYLSIGEKKSKIIAQILIEVIGTAVIGITLAVFAGTMISGAVARIMLENELIEQYSNQTTEFWFDPGAVAFNDIGIPRVQMTPDEMLEAFEVSLGVEVLILFYLVGLVVTAIATLVPVLYVVRLNPKKVLM